MRPEMFLNHAVSTHEIFLNFNVNFLYIQYPDTGHTNFLRQVCERFIIKFKK